MFYRLLYEREKQKNGTTEQKKIVCTTVNYSFCSAKKMSFTRPESIFCRKKSTLSPGYCSLIKKYDNENGRQYRIIFFLEPQIHYPAKNSFLILSSSVTFLQLITGNKIFEDLMPTCQKGIGSGDVEFSVTRRGIFLKFMQKGDSCRIFMTTGYDIIIILLLKNM